MTERPRLFGADYSVYVRIVRLVLAEKEIGYELVPVDIFASEGPPPHYLERHPFGRIPAFDHAGFRLYETGAIARYVDEVFEGRQLQPLDPRERARCNQIVSIADNYAYPALVWGIYVERVSKPASGAVADEAVFAAALPKARTCLKAMSDLMGASPWLAGETMSLADLYAAPIFDYFLRAREGQEMLREHENLAAWWARMSVRRSMEETRPA
ncbi:glutathione S-transferase family protein [Sinorhizobium meliloti]|uniref:glutathione S-transferase family protein n=1 Tax=Rhizobium meliloti TaxID=382 RepID=UPI0003817ED9|nr:glutathione S-transferase family protein [Sinorhizobium meliloti]PND19625.1 glutathione S-transferase family protein [Ensifer sp. MMN_5]